MDQFAMHIASCVAHDCCMHVTQALLTSTGSPEEKQIDCWQASVHASSERQAQSMRSESAVFDASQIVPTLLFRRSVHVTQQLPPAQPMLQQSESDAQA
jgi:hypothetical protein